MGNSTSTTTQAAPAKVTVADAALEQRKENERRIAHILDKVDDKGRVTCSCGMVLPSQHYYNLHVESWNHLPANSTGWPTRHFEGMGCLRKCQRGVVSKGDLEHAMFTVLTLKKQNSFSEEATRKAAKAMHDFHDVLDSVRDDAGSYVDKQDVDSVRLVGLVAASAELWPILDPSGHPPSELHAFTPLEDAKGKIRFPKVATDIFILIKSNHKDLAVTATDAAVSAFGSCVSGVESFPGFRYKKGRDLTGFIDGTRNPDHLLRALADETLIFADDQKHSGQVGDVHEGGSYMWAGRFVHDLVKFQSLPMQCKSAIIGRQYDKVSPHVGYDRRLENPHMHALPGDSHVSRGHGAMYRQAYPYVAGAEKGLYFSCYSRNLGEIDRALRRMAGRREGTPDRLLSITQAVTGNYYYVPSLNELAALKLWFRPAAAPMQQTNITNNVTQTDAVATTASASAIATHKPVEVSPSAKPVGENALDMVPSLPEPTVADTVASFQCKGAATVLTTPKLLPSASTVGPHSEDVGAGAVSETDWFAARKAQAHSFLTRRKEQVEDSLLPTTTHTTAESTAESKTETTTREMHVEIEYCTNCGYNSVFYSMKRVLEATGLSADVTVTVVPNPRFPRQSAFEVHVVSDTSKIASNASKSEGAGDVVLWSKLKLPDGRNNYSHCFPTELQMANALKHYLGVTVSADDTETEAKQEVSSVRQTIRNGVW